MAKEVDSVGTVGAETAKGAAKGAGAALFGAAAAVGLGALALSAFMVIPVAVGLLVGGGAGFLAGVATLAAEAVAVPLMGFGAGIGGIFGIGKGISKVRSERKELEAQSRDNSIASTIQAAQQQAYLAGARDGQVQVIEKLKEVQAAQEAQATQAAAQTQEKPTNFADKVKKNAITPEAIIQQREVAASTSPQVG